VEQFVLLLGDHVVTHRLPDTAGDGVALVALESLGLVKVLKAPRAKALESVTAVEVLPIPWSASPNLRPAG
jgi:hypothetical protein